MIIEELKLFLKFKSRTRKTLIVLRSFYYFLNLSAIFSSLFIGLATTIFIAGTSTSYPEGVINPYRTYLNENSNYVVLTYIVNAVVALISGVISFFVINARYVNIKTVYQRLNLEHLLYSSGELYYSNLTKEEKDYRLYRRAISIIGLEKYSTDDIVTDNVKKVK